MTFTPHPHELRSSSTAEVREDEKWTTPRVRTGGWRQLGVVNWLLAKAASRSVGVSSANLFTTLGQAGGVFRGWLYFSATMMPFGPLSRRDTEMVIIRVAQLRRCAYELDHHLRLGRRYGITDGVADYLLSRPVGVRSAGIRHRDDVVLDCVDDLVLRGELSTSDFDDLRLHFDNRRIIALTLLVGHYSALAGVVRALHIERDFSN
ncbi:carboxymuconolactone decarboxylase family protein [Rhodococcoides corynebacterioides]|uniref:carboxymuconolactone decarboxylase family protein n=1 Tax=Rhodococcoides corynebacterioides TaxID=53972 RepID=UPI0027E19F7E|nr:carboxymuconolactone decarboxylase family protein [Rhodococcus corynebacterioides]